MELTAIITSFINENDGKILNIKKSKKKFIAAAITKKILQKFLLIDEYIN